MEEGFDKLDWPHLLADGSFSPAKKGGGDCVGRGRKGKGTTLLLLTDARDIPLACHIAGANESEVHLIEPLLDRAVVDEAFWPSTRLLYDKVADSDALRSRLKDRFVELVCPHRDNRTKPPTQDERKLRRYRYRWQIERSISWLHRFRRLVVRYEQRDDLFLGFSNSPACPLSFNGFETGSWKERVRIGVGCMACTETRRSVAVTCMTCITSSCQAAGIR